MAGNKGITPEEGVQFEKGNKAAEKWTEDEALRFGNDLLCWMNDDENPENMLFEEFINMVAKDNDYAGKIYADLPSYLAKKHSSFSDILEKCRKIEEIKLKKYSLFEKVNPSMAKFLLSTQYNYVERVDLTSAGAKIEQSQTIINLGSGKNPENEAT